MATGTIGEWVRETREARGWTQSELAGMIGMRQPDISDLERGEHTPTPETAKKIAKAFGVNVAKILMKLVD